MGELSQHKPTPNTGARRLSCFLAPERAQLSRGTTKHTNKQQATREEAGKRAQQAHAHYSLLVARRQTLSGLRFEALKPHPLPLAQHGEPRDLGFASR
jgi:hypothetical protein